MSKDTKRKKKQTPHIIVIGNEKGGVGKTTTAIHLTSTLFNMGHAVGVVDMDPYRPALTHFFENRAANADIAKENMPTYMSIAGCDLDTIDARQDAYNQAFADIMSELRRTCATIIIDCPSGDTYLSRLAHMVADMLITPINESFFDLDVLAKLDPKHFTIKRLNRYADMVVDARQARKKADKGTLDWYVFRNRTTHVFAHNRKYIADALQHLERELNFRVIDGFAERMVYRELFLQGQTVLDLASEGETNNAHEAAAKELYQFAADLNISGVKA